MTTDIPKTTSNLPASAFLIVNTQVFPIKRALVNIGRNLDNHLVIQEESVSRVHAQLRFENDQFIIYDLNSTGGTYVNGKQVTKCVLHSGDSIVLAGVPLLFVRDTPQLAKNTLARTGPLATDYTKPADDPEGQSEPPQNG